MLLGTWNLENLYRPGGPYGPRDKAAYETKLAALAAVITELDPTLLGVQEVGDPEALEDLAGMLGGRWHVTVSRHPDDRGIRVGFLSRSLPRVLADTNGFPGRLLPVQADDEGTTTAHAGRGLLAVEVAVGGVTLKAAVAHLKSQAAVLSGRPVPAARRGRAGPLRRVRPLPACRRGDGPPRACRRVARGRGRQDDVAVLGDMNDECRRPPPRSCWARPAPRSAPPGTSTRTAATRSACGTWRPSSPRNSATHASPRGDAN